MTKESADENLHLVSDSVYIRLLGSLHWECHLILEDVQLYR